MVRAIVYVHYLLFQQPVTALVANGADRPLVLKISLKNPGSGPPYFPTSYFESQSFFLCTKSILPKDNQSAAMYR